MQPSVVTPLSKDILVYLKYRILASYCERLTIAEKRQIFCIMRSSSAKVVDSSDADDDGLKGLCNAYLPKFGLTLGEFALFHTLGEHIRRRQETE